MPEIKIITEIKIIFDQLRRPNMTEEIITELKDTLTETFKTEKQREQRLTETEHNIQGL